MLKAKDLMISQCFIRVCEKMKDDDLPILCIAPTHYAKLLEITSEAFIKFLLDITEKVIKSTDKKESVAILIG
jgi:hypothetical protein